MKQDCLVRDGLYGMPAFHLNDEISSTKKYYRNCGIEPELARVKLSPIHARQTHTNNEFGYALPGYYDLSRLPPTTVIMRYIHSEEALDIPDNGKYRDLTNICGFRFS